MAVANARGFIASRHLTGGQITSVMRPTLASNTTKIYPGDPVWVDENGKVQRVITTESTVASKSWLGIVKAVYAGAEKQRPSIHNFPGNAVPVSTTGWVEVHEDPDIIYTVNCSVSMSAPQIGKYVLHVIPDANTAAGWSRAGINGLETTVSSLGHVLRIVRVSQRDPVRPTLMDDAYNVNNDVEVIIAKHFWHPTASQEEDFPS